MEAPTDKEEDYIKLVKSSNNVEFKTNEEIDMLEICMEKSINLKMFQHFVNIKELYLIKNNITDITPLFECKHLKVLFLQINKIKSILGLGRLKKLEKLNLFCNELTEDFIKLEENKNLHYIDLSDNEIENVDFFSTTSSFTSINLANNRIRNLDPLRNNSNLEYLNVSGNRLEHFEDIQVLNHLQNVKELYLSSIYYRSNILKDGLLYKHYFFTNFPNLQILDHQTVSNKERNLAVRDMEILKSIVDFKINLIEEKYKKEKHYILFINNKNISYLREVLWPIHFYYNMEEFPRKNNMEREHDRICEIKQEISFLLSAYISRFNYIMKRLKEERNLQIKYITTSMNSYFNIFFQVLTKQEMEYAKVEQFLKGNFNSESLKSYFVEDIKIENIIKVKKLNNVYLNTLIENHLNSVIYKKNLLLLHPYNYCKINEFFEFDEKEAEVEDPERKKFFEKNFVCSCCSLNHVLKTVIRTFLNEDEKDGLVHPIYYKSRGYGTPTNKAGDESCSPWASDMNMKKKIVRNKKFDFPPFIIYIVENYFFPNEYHEVTAYSSQNCKENKQNDETKFKIYYTLPRHTNLKYIVNINLINNNTKRPDEGREISRVNSFTKGNDHEKNIKKKKKKKNFLNYVKIDDESPLTKFSSLSKKIKEDFYDYLLTFNSVNFFHITKYFIKLSKVICEIKKCVCILLSKNKLKCLLDMSSKNFHEKMEISLPEHVHVLKNKKINVSLLIHQSSDRESDNTTVSTLSERCLQEYNTTGTLYLNSLYICKIDLHIIEDHFKNIKKLCLVNNNISDLNVLFQFSEEEMNIPSLVHLDLSFNCITSLIPICNKFRNLTHLDVSFNYIFDYMEIMVFSKNHKKIEFLSIISNPMYMKPAHYSNIHLLFPRIECFNGVHLTSRPEFDLDSHSFVPCHGEIFLYQDDLEKKPEIIFKEPILDKQDLSQVKIINLSDLYTPMVIICDFSKLSNLEILNLSNNGIDNLEKLKLPTSLKILNLKNNKIQNINFLRNNLNIEKIILDNNKLVNIEKISSLKKLKVLRCAYNKLLNIPLIQNTQLVELNIHDNMIKDITHLVLMKYKKSLTSINIYNNKINFPNLDIYLIHTFCNLLILNNNYVERNENIDKFFKNIYTINVFFDIYNIYPPYTALQHLEIKNMKIKSIMFTINNDNFANLHHLDISNNLISTIANIGPLDNLKVLIMNNNKHISDESFTGKDETSVLNSFKCLEELDISYCMVARTNFLNKCTNLKNLKKLNLEGNNINSVKHLSHLEILKDLNLSNNKISKMSPDTFPVLLQSLNLSNNLIRNLSPLSTLKNLETLDLRVNRIDNIEEFKFLKDMNNLKTLYLNGNRKIKESFPNIRNILRQVDTFDMKIMKDHDEMVQHVVEKKECTRGTREVNNKEFCVESIKEIHKEVTRKGVPIHVQTKVHRTPMKKDSFDERIKNDSFIIIGRKIDKSGDY
ncbi:hypothetical protein, conserved [Plasmodium gonderi]|uniref:Leucine-rich repeat protein n=1 Tax=Plasmodium gonderi TaxID=77519 RepID=A0A1Y1JPZ5_PLAGO|nr:hypothetical protein, conserved [Plasmodium gonderi]GAW82912.1 hypothetical protein, conserved [Plasmodium gonderi]